MPSIEDRIKEMENDLGDMKPTFAVFGPEGVGKTTFVSYAPNLLIIDVENGRSSIMKTPNEPKIFEPENCDDLTEIYIYLKANEDKFDSVAIDTFTEVEKWFLDDVIKKQAKKDSTKDTDLATQADYKKASHRMRKMARKFRALDMYTFFICHEREDKDDSTGIVRKAPAVMPSVMKDLNAFTDFIFFLSVDENGGRKLQTAPSNRIRAKHRIGELPRVIDLGNNVEDCRIDMVLDMIDNSSKKGDK